MNSVQYRMTLVATTVLIMVAACAQVPSDASRRDSPGFFAEPVDFNGVTFLSGRPQQGEQIEKALSGASDLESLENDLAILRRMPADISLGVIGSTDAKECAGADCAALSLRRAECLHNWLISHGVPASRLSSPRGYGSSRAIGDNETEEGRAQNRRAYISFEGTNE